MTAKGQNFEFFQGDTKEIIILVKDEDGNLFDLTGFTALWIVYHPTTKAIILSKSSGSGITIPTPLNGEIVISLTPTDSENIVPRIYNHECEIQTNPTDVHTVSVGTVNILYSKA